MARGDDRHVGIGLRGLGDVLGLQGRLSEAEATYLRSIEHSRVIGDRATTSVSQVHLAMLAEFPAHSSQMRATIHVLATDARRQREVGARVRAEVSEAGIAQARSEAAALALPAVVAEILVAAV